MSPRIVAIMSYLPFSVRNFYLESGFIPLICYLCYYEPKACYCKEPKLYLSWTVPDSWWVKIEANLTFHSNTCLKHVSIFVCKVLSFGVAFWKMKLYLALRTIYCCCKCNICYFISQTTPTAFFLEPAKLLTSLLKNLNANVSICLSFQWNSPALNYVLHSENI